MPSFAASTAARRLGAELALWVAIGVVMAFLGPFGWSERSLAERLLYWLCAMVGGGLIGVAVDTLVRRRLDRFWPRLLAVSALMTPPVMLLVGLVNIAMFGTHVAFWRSWPPWFQVFIVCFAAMALRQLAWDRPQVREAEAPGTASDAAFRRRLSAKRREARLIAVEAEDHYLRVHTDAGDELVTARFADALDELAGVKGFRTHRSWWVAADAIEAVRWKRGRGEAALAGGLVVPVSRSNAAALKEAGWF